MCFLHFAAEHISREVARGCAARGVLFKRTAYNFVSLAHDEATVDQTLRILDEVLGADPSRLRRSGCQSPRSAKGKERSTLRCTALSLLSLSEPARRCHPERARDSARAKDPKADPSRLRRSG